MNKKITAFLDKVKADCTESGISYVNKPYGEIQYNGIMCNGYFCDIKNELAFWTDPVKMDWFLIAIHEYSHFLQWKEKKEYWNSLVHDKNYSVNLIDDWMSGTEFSTSQVSQIINNTINIEYDCEKNAVNLIIEYGLQETVNIKEYIQKSNAYVLYYHIVKRDRKFYDKHKEPYAIKEIYSKMPDYFLGNPYSSPEIERIISIFDEEYSKLA